MKQYLILIFLLFGLSFCAGGNIKIKLNPDLSGNFLIYQKKIKNKVPSSIGPGSNLSPVSETELVLKERTFQFRNITSVLTPGIRFIIYKEADEETSTFLMTVDTSSRSPLLKTLEIEKDEVLALAKEAKTRDDIYRFNNLAEHIQFEIFLPFNVSQVYFSENRTPGDWTARNDGGGKIVVNLPLASFWENKFQQTGVIVKFKE
ncbi:LBF_1134 family protein [Leptospira sp. 'Mane']|uniref:LBF_1134 family protein n=1 Tax=Leptospira sp. 'Mane' TaxID=3387407 RepID=UPI00398B6178